MKTTPAKLMFLIAVLTLSLRQAACAYYDPGMQRWINRDPVEEKGGINVYQLVFNDPLSAVDPFGESVLDDLNDPCSKNSLEKGAKCYGEWQKHMDDLRSLCKQVHDLEDKLKSTKGPKARKPIEEEIAKVKKMIKGHQKEIKQKWPNGPPCCP
jgi:uncharacterized protein RhaS with RHS repeats